MRTSPASIPGAAVYKSTLESHFRRPLREAFGGARLDELLAGGESVGCFYQSQLQHLTEVFDLTSAPLQYQEELRRIAWGLPFYGLYTNCMLYDYPRRLDFSLVDVEKVESEWVVRSLTANSFLSAADKQNLNWPSAIYDVFAFRLEQIQKSLSFGWFRRMRNDSKFKNLFASGFLLGVMHDYATQSANPALVHAEITDDDIPF